MFPNEDIASLGDWIYLVIVLVGDAILLAVVAIAWRRRTNPHTGLARKLKRRRARGPLRK